MTAPRPTSPHLTIYSWLMTNTLSILHRLTGVGLVVGTLLLVLWLFSAAYHPQFYYALQSFMTTLPGRALMLGWTVAFFFHFSNGIRHLMWDIGHGFELRQVHQSGWVVLIFTVLMTAVTWWLVLGVSSDI